jgi:hypothetical protein
MLRPRLAVSAVAVAAVLASSGCEPSGWAVVDAPSGAAVLSVAYAPTGDGALAVGGALGSGGEALLLVSDGDGSGGWRRVSVGTDATLWWVHAFARDDAWVVGERGTIGHFDGSAVAFESVPTDRTLYGLWGTRADDLWAVGGQPGRDGVLLHRDASGWRAVTPPVPVGALFKVWGSGADDVFVCGEGGTMLHHDGAGWSAQPTGLPPSVTLFTVAGRGPREVYAVGGIGRGVALVYDGTTWAPLADPALEGVGGLAGVAVSPSGALTIVGSAGTKLVGAPGRLVDETRSAPRDDLHAAASRGERTLAVGGAYVGPPGSPRSGVIAIRR